MDKTSKQFDSWRFVQLARAEIEEETKDMSPNQIVEYYRNYPYDSRHTEIDATRLPWWESYNEGDKQQPGCRNFDSIGYVRWARTKIAAETEGMSREEIGEYWRNYRENDPLWQRLTAIEAERSKQR